MDEHSTSALIVIRVAATMLACGVCVWIGWVFYQGTMHPASPLENTPPMNADLGSSQPVQQPSKDIQYSESNPTFLTVSPVGASEPVPCANFTGFTYAEDVARFNDADNEIDPYLKQSDVMPFQADYHCDAKGSGNVVETYEFYSISGHTDYTLIKFGKPGVLDDLDIYPVSYPGDGCAKPLQWNVASADAITKFFAPAPGVTFVQNAAGDASATFDVKLACMPPGNMQWMINWIPSGAKVGTYMEYPAAI